MSLEGPSVDDFKTDAAVTALWRAGKQPRRPHTRPYGKRSTSVEMAPEEINNEKKDVDQDEVDRSKNEEENFEEMRVQGEDENELKVSKKRCKRIKICQKNSQNVLQKHNKVNK